MELRVVVVGEQKAPCSFKLCWCAGPYCHDEMAFLLFLTWICNRPALAVDEDHMRGARLTSTAVLMLAALGWAETNSPRSSG